MAETRGRGRPKNTGDSCQLHLTVPKRLFEYLTYLAANSVIGAHESDVAAYLLTKQVEGMVVAGFHKIEMPKSDA